MFTKLISASLLGLCSIAYASPTGSPCSGMWNVVCAAGTTDNIRATGNLIMNNTIVTQNVTVDGRARISKAKIQSLRVNGKADLGNTIVLGNTRIDGNLKLDQSILKGDAHVLGRLSMFESKLFGKLNIVGYLQLDKAVISGPIKILSTDADFTRSKVASITFQHNHSVWHDKDILTLDDSIVSGNITFQDKNGIVRCEGKSVIHGKVIGGKIEKETTHSA